MRKPLVKRPDLPIAPIAAPDHSTGGTAGKLMNSPMPRKLMLQLLGMTAGLTLSAWGNAVGLGGINVVSGLGQPLKAEIELVAVSKTDKPGLVARLASPDAYKGAGLDYPSGVKYSFEVGSRANGEPYLKLSSNREINDPFVSLLIELSWSSGKLMREYTFLLDPPGYVAAQPAAAAVQAVAPEVVQSAPLIAPVEKPEQVRQLAKPVESIAKPVERPVARPAEKQAVRTERRASASVTTGAITVKQGDTLNALAAGIKPDDVSLERMLVALYRANAEQFDGKNMNRIRSGKILRVPDHDEVINVTQVEANREIHAQTSDWNAYRQKLAGAATVSRQAEDTKRVATGKITAPVADKTPVASESAKEVLRLSKGAAPGDKTGAAGSKTERRNAAAEDAIAKAKAVEEGKTRAALLESNLKDMQRLAQLKSEAAALVASAAASKETAMPVVASAVAAGEVVSTVAAASEVAAVSPVAASQVAAASAVKPAEAEEVSLLDRLMPLLDKLLGSSVALWLGAAALLALAGLGIVIKRRRQSPEKAAKLAENEFGATTGHLTTPVAPSPDTGDFTATAIHAEEAAPHPDDVDPISEAELFLNFGRDEQAEEVLKDALLRSPDNHQVHLKLLGIYAKRQDADAFAKVAGLLEKTGDIDAIQQAEVLAQKMEPAKASIEDAESATTLTAALNPDVEPDMKTDETPFAHDLVLPDVEPAEAVEEELPAQVEAIDFDVTSTLPAQQGAVDFDVTSTSPMLAVPDVLDFDIATKEPEIAEHHEDEALPSLDDLIFDVMPAPASEAGTEAVAASSAEKTPDEDDGMEFTLDFPLDDVTEKFVPPAPVINLSDISLDMDDVSAPVAEVAAVEKSEQWHEVATKLDLARAYQEMGDEVGAREILEEVMKEGDEAQQQEAQLFIKQLS